MIQRCQVTPKSKNSITPQTRNGEVILCVKAQKHCDYVLLRVIALTAYCVKQEKLKMR